MTETRKHAFVEPESWLGLESKGCRVCALPASAEVHQVEKQCCGYTGQQSSSPAPQPEAKEERIDLGAIAAERVNGLNWDLENMNPGIMLRTVMESYRDFAALVAAAFAGREK